jgi:hypothetical protein
MHLYLGTNPRVVYLITSSQEERHGRPPRALVFRAGENDSQVIVEFLHKHDVNLSKAIRLTNRVVKGCLGLISVDNGQHISLSRLSRVKGDCTLQILSLLS